MTTSPKPYCLYKAQILASILRIQETWILPHPSFFTDKEYTQNHSLKIETAKLFYKHLIYHTIYTYVYIKRFTENSLGSTNDTYKQNKRGYTKPASKYRSYQRTSQFHETNIYYCSFTKMLITILMRHMKGSHSGPLDAWR